MTGVDEGEEDVSDDKTRSYFFFTFTEDCVEILIHGEEW